MKAYLGAKIIKAMPMTENEFLQKYKGQNQFGPENSEGYLVAYSNPGKPDYSSWSPKGVFEEAYRPLNSGEVAFVMETEKLAAEGAPPSQD